jgi:hypothetical protein
MKRIKGRTKEKDSRKERRKGRKKERSAQNVQSYITTENKLLITISFSI